MTTLATLPGRCPTHALTHCWDCGWITPDEAAALYAEVAHWQAMYEAMAAAAKAGIAGRAS